MTNQTQLVSFHGTDLVTLKHNNVVYTAVKPIAEAIGLDWKSQQRKLQNQMNKFNCGHMTIVAEDGKNREMLCMPLRKLNGWLFSINPAKVKPELKDGLIQYQEECFEALHDYWTTGTANRPKTDTDDRNGLRNAVKRLASKKGINYSDAYTLVHQYMNVEHIDEIPKEDIQTAVAYCHKVILEGEFIPNDALSHQRLESLNETIRDVSRKADMPMVYISGKVCEHFNVNSLQDIFETQYSEAINFVQKFLPKQRSLASPNDTIVLNYPKLPSCTPFLLFEEMHDCGWHLKINQLLGNLKRGSNNTVFMVKDLSGIEHEVNSLLHLIEMQRYKLSEINRISRC